jgi:hypothetical protein
MDQPTSRQGQLVTPEGAGRLGLSGCGWSLVEQLARLQHGMHYNGNYRMLAL